MGENRTFVLGVDIAKVLLRGTLIPVIKITGWRAKADCPPSRTIMTKAPPDFSDGAFGLNYNVQPRTFTLAARKPFASRLTSNSTFAPSCSVA